MDIQTTPIIKLIKRLRDMTIYDAAQYVETLKHYQTLPRYQEDLDFKILVDVSLMTYHASRAENESSISDVNSVLDQINNISNLYLKGEAYLRIGFVFMSLSLLDNAMQAYLSIVHLATISREKNNLLPMAYNNIANIMGSIGDEESAIQYAKMAISSVVDDDPVRDDYEGIAADFCANLALLLARKGDIKGATSYVKQAVGHIDNDSAWTTFRIIYETRMHLYAHLGDLEKMHKSFLAAMQLAEKNRDNVVLFSIFINYYRLCVKTKALQAYYKPYMDKLHGKVSIDNYMEELIEFYQIYLTVYAPTGERDKVDEGVRRLLKYINDKKQFDTDRSKYGVFAQMVNMTKLSQNFDENTDVDDELLEDLLSSISMNKIQHELSYERLKLLVGFGQHVTATLDIDEIAQRALEHFSAVFSVDSFIFLRHDKTKDALVSVLYHEFEQQMDDITIYFNHPNSFNIKAFQTRELIYSEDVTSDERFKHLRIKKGTNREAQLKSCLYIPLVHEQRALGVISMQSRRENAYQPKDILYINAVSPYIAIALLNSNLSQELNVTIEDQREARRELVLTNRHLQDLSNFDALTKVYNRRAFDERFAILADRVKRLKVPMTLYMFDIDNFKLYNDTYGHIKGDEVLQIVARTISAAYNGEHAIFARYGGEEFIAADLEKSSIESKEKADLIRESIENLKIENKESLDGYLTLSIGFCHCTEYAKTDKAHLYEVADDRLYDAKKSGRNTTRFGTC